MIQLKKIEGTDIYEFLIDGEIDQESIDNFYKFFDLLSEDNEKVKLLGTIKTFPSLEDFKSFGDVFKMKKSAYGCIKKYALLTDNDWLETFLPIGDFLTPGLPLKQFDLDEREDAISWLNTDEDNTVTEEDYLSKMNIHKIKDTNIISFTVDGKIDQGGMSALYNAIKDKSRKDKINILGHYKDFSGFDSFKAFTQGIKLDFASFGELNKFAIITDKTWVNKIAEAESKVLPGITMKAFTEAEEKEAITWLEA